MFPNLQALHLNGNCLGESLEGLKELAEDQTPRRLHTLFLNENKLASWKAVAALSEYVLLELKVQRNPVNERTASERYLVGIALQQGNQVINALSEGCNVQ